MYEHIIKHYTDFPKPGIDFIDILPFLHDKTAFRDAVCRLDTLCTAPNVATVEARGFLFAAPLLVQSEHIQTLVPVRKKGKLPYAEGDLHSVSIEKEYGRDEVYYRLSDLAACRPEDGVVELTLLDDLLATGGTALGIAQALNRETVNGCRVHVKEFLFLVELTDLQGRAQLEQLAPVRSLMSVGGTES
ncbi:MAG: adenine phosphoribosyltransferase [bacterium P3]|nr:MAG: adenine phosphoribosyltransferase [bacterium P3]KWW41951.1 MAG: adenine phosphoribosyltransferase [bacterium F083]